MNWVDIVILVLVLGLGFMGWRNGVIRLAFTLVGGIAGLVLAGQLFDDVAPAIPVGDNEGVQQLIAFVLVLGVVLVISWVLARLVKTLLTVLLLGWVDGLAGAALGLLIGAFLATGFVSAAAIVPSDTVKEAVAESSLAEPLSDNLGVVRALLPDRFDSVKDILDQGGALLGQGKDLLTQGSEFLARSEQLRELLEQGGNLLEQSERLQEFIDKGEGIVGSGESFTVVWDGLEDFEGFDLFVVFVPDAEEAIRLGPFRTVVGADGVAAVSVEDGFDPDSAYEVHWMVDGNDNGVCDDTDEDVKRLDHADAGQRVLTVSYSSADPDGDCGQLS